MHHATSEADVARGRERLQETMGSYASIYVLPLLTSRHNSSLLTYAVSKSVLAPKIYVSRRLL